METFLNLAHRSHRKAEFYTSNHQFYQAIYHHKVASEYLEKAIIQTHCDNIRASLISQRKHNLTQIDLLTRRLAIQLNSAAKPSDGCRPAESPSEPSLQALTTHLHSSQPHQSHTGSLKMAAELLEQKYKDLYQIMNEQDELIQSLLDARPKASPSKRAGNKDREEKEVAEQLLAINDKVRRWVTSLVEKLEKSTDECKSLREDNERLRKEITHLKSQHDREPHIPELPSLEPPTLFY